MAYEQIRKEIEDSHEKLYDKDGEAHSIVRYKGVPFPNISALPEALSQLHDLQAHKDDVFICAYPCCGTHWLWEVASMIMKEKAERIKVGKEEFMIDFVPRDQFADKPPPRVFNTHVQPQFLPETVLTQNKIIMVVRNPKDMLVSYYRHNLGMTHKGYNGTFTNFFETLLENRVPYGGYFDYLKKWWRVIKDNPNCLIVSYEEASQNLLKTVNKMGKFLGKPPSPELAAGITELCTFDKMKNEKVDAMEEKEKGFWKQGYSFYRKGKVAAWKEWFTVSQSELIDECVKTELADCDYPIIYSIGE